mmetsp:Transcript_50735/g.126293  ORF Transcript_50735/g.126293 Transcript_50735/m.126293 type:complete len:272 (-) Transcript_50735:143-958(-)
MSLKSSGATSPDGLTVDTRSVRSTLPKSISRTSSSVCSKRPLAACHRSANRYCGSPPGRKAAMRAMATSTLTPSRDRLETRGRHSPAHFLAAVDSSAHPVSCAYCAAAATVVSSRVPRSTCLTLSTPYLSARSHIAVPSCTGPSSWPYMYPMNAAKVSLGQSLMRIRPVLASVKTSLSSMLANTVDLSDKTLRCAHTGGCPLPNSNLTSSASCFAWAHMEENTRARSSLGCMLHLAACLRKCQKGPEGTSGQSHREALELEQAEEASPGVP